MQCSGTRAVRSACISVMVSIGCWLCIQRGWYASSASDDAVVVAARSPSGLDGFFLYEHEIDALRMGRLRADWQRQLDREQQQPGRNKRACERLVFGLEHFEALQNACLWHQRCITTGLHAEKPSYPYVPHMFSLWQLAPSRGKGVSIGLIDTGVAAFTIKESKQHIKHKHIAMPSYVWPSNYTIIGSSGNPNPLYHLVKIVQQHADAHKYVPELVERQLSEAILQYLESGDTALVYKLCVSVFQPTLLTQQGTLSDAGNAVFEDILRGPYGIMPYGKKEKTAFIVGTVTHPFTRRVLLNNLPTPARSDAQTNYIAGHGTHAFGQIATIAPCATIHMIKAFDDEGVTKKSHLITALTKAHACHVDIVNLSLKVADTLDRTDASTRQLEHTLAQIPYVVCASGNDGDATKSSYKGDYLSYPARFDAAHWTVGSFGCADGAYTVSEFSQFERGKGPLFLAPGAHILSAGLVPGNYDDSTYVFMTGTSMAVPLMSAFLALVLGEFRTLFSQDQIKEVCCRSGFLLHDTPDWKQKSCYGVLDMRTALFILHVLAAVYKENRVAATSKEFTMYVDAICRILDQPALLYGNNRLAHSFRGALIDYVAAAHRCKQEYVAEDFFPFCYLVR